jgi:hypothetical protein
MSELPYDFHPAVRRERISTNFINSERGSILLSLGSQNLLDRHAMW